MHMTFYWGMEVSILFDGWRTQTLMQYWGSLLVLFLASVFHEYVVSIRAHIRMKYNNIISRQENSYNSMESAEPQAKSMHLLPLTQRRTRCYVIKIAETLLFGVNALLGYLLMLAAMSYNGGVVLAIVVGLSVGFFSFRSVGNFNVSVHQQEEDEEDLHLSADPCSSCT